MNRQQQTVRYATATDGVRLAWARVGPEHGEAPALVRAANWVTHLEYDWESPVWRHWMQFLSGNFQFYRYDERGNGLSQRDPEDVSEPLWLSDLETVVEAAQPPEPFVLLGISQGSVACIRFAAKYPEKVSHLVLYGGYARGHRHRGSSEGLREYNAIIELTELGWGRPDPMYRRLFTRRFLPEGTEEQLSWFDDLCAKTTSPRLAARLLRSRLDVDTSHLLGDIGVPTLVMHANKDRVVPFECGQEIAAGIPGAEFVQLESCNHVLMAAEPAWERFQELVLEFTGAGAGQASFEGLSERESQILALIVEGKTNQEIGDALFISEKTVRNHITHVYEKLGVKTRAQAMVRAREAGF